MSSKKITLGLFIVYLLGLTWVIVFKTQFSLGNLPEMRSINLIPFAESVFVNGKIDYTEVIQNALIFVPYGIFISALMDKKTFTVKILPIVLTSLVFETIQFVFGIGASDITDIIANTIGGIIGIAIAFVFSKIFKDNWKKIINGFCLVGGIILISFVVIVLIANL